MLRKACALFLLLLIPLSSAWAEDFDEGIEYETIASPVRTSDPGKVVVTEMFWYGCPHCFRFEPYINRWKETIPEGVVLEQVPSVLNPSWMEHARAYFALMMLEGDTDKAHQAFFSAIHLQNRSLNNVDQIAKFIGEQGLDEKAFRNHYHSFPVDTLIRKNRQKERRYGHRGVPAVIVNGKYRTSASMAGSNSRMIKVIDYLVARELAAK